MTASIDLGKLRFHFAGDWSNSALYEPNDIVKYGGNVYVYTYMLKTSGNVPTDTVYWALMAEGFKFRGVYAAGLPYRIGDAVAYGGSIYIAKQDTTGNVPTSVAYWDKFAPGINNKGAWGTAIQYKPEDIVQYGGNAFICLVAHASGTFAADLAGTKWQKFNGGIRWRGTWITGASYVVDDIVSDGLSTYICKADHTSGNFSTDLTAVKWELMVLGQAVLPLQTEQNGKLLKTDGTTPYWTTDPLTAPAGNNKQKLAISDGTVVTYDAFPLNAMYVAAQ